MLGVGERRVSFEGGRKGSFDVVCSEGTRKEKYT